MSLRSPLPSVFHRFDRVCHRAFHRPFDRVSSLIRSAFFDPPTPLGAIEALAAASVAACATPAWKGRAEGPRLIHARGNREMARLCSCIMPVPIRELTRYRNGYRTICSARLLPGRFPSSRSARPVGHKQLIALAPQRGYPLCPNHVAMSGEGISRAGANSVFHSVEADQARPHASAMRICVISRQKDRGGWCRGSNASAVDIFELPRNFRGPPRKPRHHSQRLLTRRRWCRAS